MMCVWYAIARQCHLPPVIITYLWIYLPSDSTVRLTAGASQYEGRVEVFINGSWGRVCDMSDWTHDNMQVVCYNLFRFVPSWFW